MADSKSTHQVVISAQDKATAVVRGVEGAFRSLGALVGGTAVAGAFMQAAKQGIEFEKSIAKVSTLLPGATNNMTAFAKGIERIKLKGLGESLSELSDGLYEAISAGVPAAKSIQFLEVAAKASKAGFTDMRTAVDGLTTVLNSYQMQTERVTEVADIMFTAQNRGKTTFGEMAAGLGQLLPVASSVGVKFEDVAAALSTLTIKGMPTAIAITGLRSVLAAFIEQGDSGKFSTLGLAGALKELEEKTGGNEKKMQDYLGRVEALTTALALTGKNTQQLAADMEAMKTATGAADMAVSKFMDTAEGRLNKFKSFVSVAMAEFGQGFADPISRVLPGEDKTLRQAEAFNTLGRAIGNIAVGLGYIAAIPMAVLNFVGGRIGNIAGHLASGGIYEGQTLFNPGRLPDVMGPPVSPASTFIGPMPSAVEAIQKAGGEVANALKGVAIELQYWGPTLNGSRFGDGVARIGRLGSAGRGGIGMQAGRGRGRLSGGLFDTQFQAGNVPGAENFFGAALPGVDELNKKIQSIAPAFQFAMTSVTNAIVQGAITGALKIKDVFNALRNAIMQILADLAARAATAGLLSLFFPSIGFAGAFKGLATGNFTGGTNSYRPSPIGANPGVSGFGGMRPVTINIYGSGQIQNVADLERELAGRIQRGQSKLNKFL